MNQPKDKNPLKKKDQLNSYARLSGLGLQMLGIIAVGTFVGVKLDERYPNESNWFTLGLTLFSVIGAIVYVIRRIIAASN
ncbi:AtpZ/AtpI family protein [Winogradskyella aurantiaca]|uniref:AtpZ/AtpI family protein n=1 Tax=Winogradskyella aurantiaca TaxID=2219558 RepID=UPI000E1CFE36|nr:AtpZ/AtpI family protein [Winogradskyella aurantiaca]